MSFIIGNLCFTPKATQAQQRPIPSRPAQEQETVDQFDPFSEKKLLQMVIEGSKTLFLAESFGFLTRTLPKKQLREFREDLKDPQDEDLAKMREIYLKIIQEIFPNQKLNSRSKIKLPDLLSELRSRNLDSEIQALALLYFFKIPKSAKGLIMLFLGDPQDPKNSARIDA